MEGTKFFYFSSPFRESVRGTHPFAKSAKGWGTLVYTVPRKGGPPAVRTEEAQDLKKFAIFALLNLIFIRIWFTLQSRGILQRYWINLLILVVLVLMDYVAVRAVKLSLSVQEAEFIRRHLLPIGFVVIIFLGSTNSFVTIIIGRAHAVDFGNIVVGLILVPLIVTILRRNWKRSIGDNDQLRTSK
jgi:hypothetical protein